MEIAKKSCLSLEKALLPTIKGAVYLSVNNSSMELPVSVVNSLVDLLTDISKGKQITDSESLSTQHFLVQGYFVNCSVNLSHI